MSRSMICGETESSAAACLRRRKMDCGSAEDSCPGTPWSLSLRAVVVHSPGRIQGQGPWLPQRGAVVVAHEPRVDWPLWRIPERAHEGRAGLKFLVWNFLPHPKTIRVSLHPPLA